MTEFINRPFDGVDSDGDYTVTAKDLVYVLRTWRKIKVET